MALVEKKCPVCGVIYGLDLDFWDYRKKGGMSDGRPARWFCPNGHSLVVSESDADALRRERDLLKQQIAQKNDQIESEKRRASAAVGQVTKLKNRAKAGVCPCCNRTFQNVARHMQSKHPEFDPKVVDIDDEKRKRA